MNTITLPNGTTAHITGYRNADSTMMIRHTDGTTERIPMPACTNCGSSNVTSARFCKNCSTYYPNTHAEAEAQIESSERTATLIDAHKQAANLKANTPNPTTEQARTTQAEQDRIVQEAATRVGACSIDIVNAYFAAQRTA